MKRLIVIVLMLLAIDPVSSQELDLTNAMPSGPLIQSSSFENCQIFQGGATCGEWNNTGLGDWGKYENSSKEFLFSYDTTRLWQDIDISNLNTNQFAYYLYFDLNASCKNSIGGYCENPEGPADFFSARLNFYSGDTLFKQDILLDGATYTQDWTPFLFSGQIDSANQITMIQVEFYGQDVGYWAGFYGPRLDNAQLSLLYNEIEIAVDCQLTPYDPTCIIQDLTTFSDEELLALTDTTTDTGDNGSDDGSEPIAEEDDEETLVANETDETVEETNLEETLQDEETTTDEEVVVAQSVEREVAYRELTDEEKAQILADSISKSTLEAALSIAEAASSTTTSTITETTVASTSRTTIVTETEENQNVEKIDSLQEQLADTGTDAAMEIFETGRTLNASSLQYSQQQSEQSASDSVNQAETIAENSSMVNSVNSLREDAVAALATELESASIMESISIEMPVSDTQDADFAMPMVSAAESETVDVVLDQTSTESVIVEESILMAGPESMANTTSETIDSFADIMMIEISAKEASADDLEFVNNIQATLEQQQQQDNSESALTQEEQITIQNDPALANAFNLMPNVNNLEFLGVLSNRAEDKSDAEKRAEQVTAANKEQQDEINKNYMDADQSGIVAAMGADTDVNSYRSAMLNDNNTWYRPEDIYKNVVYKDNVRGAYYLEKGNSDTYRRMVDEQYK